MELRDYSSFRNSKNMGELSTVLPNDSCFFSYAYPSRLDRLIGTTSRLGTFEDRVLSARNRVDRLWRVSALGLAIRLATVLQRPRDLRIRRS
jgi:hypothetical protein